MPGGNVGSVAPLTTTFAILATLTGGVKKGPMRGILRRNGVCWKAYRGYISSCEILFLCEMYRIGDSLYHLKRRPHSPERYLQRPDGACPIYITWPENYPCKRIFKSNLEDRPKAKLLIESIRAENHAHSKEQYSNSLYKNQNLISTCNKKRKTNLHQQIFA